MCNDMKKLMNIFVLVAVAAMTLASCQKNEINGPVNKEVHFTIKADIAETKTAITDKGNGTYTPTWAKGDKIGVLFSLEESAKPVDFENTAVAGDEATFEGKHAFAVVEGASEVDGNLYAFYPSSAFGKVYSDGDVRLDLNATQYPTSTSFDPSCDLLIAKPCYYMAEATGEDAEVVIDDMYFARMMSVLRINLNSEFLSNETVKSISFDADGVDFTGAMRFNLETGEFVGNQSTSQDLSEVKAIYSAEDPIYVAGEKNSAYLVLAPVTIPLGTTLTFTIETENFDIVKTVNAPDMEMPAGNIAVINLTIAEENCTPKVEDTPDYSGEYLIVNTDLTKAASKWANGNNLPAVALNAVDGVVYESDNLTDCKMTITKVTEGENLGCYTIQDASNRYLYAASTSANRLNARQEASYWDITEKDGIYTIKSKENTTRNWMRFNNSDNIFNCYSSGQQDITLYKYSDIQVDNTPSISLTKNSDEVTYDATSYEFTYTTKNIAGNVVATIKDGATMANVSASASNGTVTVNFDANADAEQKTATIILSYEGATSQEFVLTQAGKPAAGTVVDVLTRVTTGISSGAGYSSWSGKTVTSSAVYAGQSAGGNDAIQLRTTNSNSGVVTTTSGGKVKKIKVTWQSATTSGRTLDIYGKNTAYTAATDLYSTSTQGTKLGSIEYGTSTDELVISGDYEYIGFRSNSGALYLTDVEITWETSGSGGEVTPDPEEPENPTPDPGQTKTYTLTIKSTDLQKKSGSGYAAYNGSHTLTATASDNSTMAVEITTNQVMPGTNPSGTLQFQKNTGVLYNVTDLGTITSVSYDINKGSGVSYVIGSSENPTSSVDGGAYFVVKYSTSAAVYFNSITITFKK